MLRSWILRCAHLGIWLLKVGYFSRPWNLIITYRYIIGPGKISWKQHQNIEYWKKSSTLLRWLSSTDNLHTWMEIHFNGCNDIKNENFTPFCNLKRYFIVETLKPDGILYTYLAIDKMGVNNFFKVILFWLIEV